jgi:hypothetical protein
VSADSRPRSVPRLRIGNGASNNGCSCKGTTTVGRIFIPGLHFDDVEKRVLRLTSIYPRSSVSCAALTFRTRFTAFADHVAHSRPFVNTRPTVVVPLRLRTRLLTEVDAETSSLARFPASWGAACSIVGLGPTYPVHRPVRSGVDRQPVHL